MNKPSGPNSIFEFRLCTNAACRFRFPAPAHHPQLCPHCQAPTIVADVSMPRSESSRPQAPSVPLVGVLDNIRSLYNVGSLFRTADGLGVEHLYLCGITATPAHPRLAKTALGAERAVAWSAYKNGLDCVLHLKNAGYTICTLESTDSAIPLHALPAAHLGGAIALVVGNEKVGVDPGLLRQSDFVISIPMRGLKSSLNVAIAFGIAAYRLALHSTDQAAESLS